MITTVQRLQQQQREQFAMLKELTNENRNLKLQITEMRMARLRKPEDKTKHDHSIPKVISEKANARNPEHKSKNV